MSPACRQHPVTTLDSPLQVACALALNTKAEDAKRQRWHQGARSGAYQAGWRGELAGGGAPEVRAGPRLSLCSVPAAYSRRRGRGWGRWGRRLCIVGVAGLLMIAAGRVSGGWSCTKGGGRAGGCVLGTVARQPLVVWTNGAGVIAPLVCPCRNPRPVPFGLRFPGI